MRRVDERDSLPWIGGPYNWILYLREVQQFHHSYQENYQKLPFGPRSLQSDTISLVPEYARGYLEELEENGLLTKNSEVSLRSQFGDISERDTNIEAPNKTEYEPTEPKRYTTTVDRRLRDQSLVRELKELYSNSCQICGARRLQSEEQGYSEVHHVKPLGRPHNGEDTKKNMMVLCPNHHADFDNGVISIEPDTRTINHSYEEVDGKPLRSRSRHTVAKKFLRYHLRNISEF